MGALLQWGAGLTRSYLSQLGKVSPNINAVLELCPGKLPPLLFGRSAGFDLSTRIESQSAGYNHSVNSFHLQVCIDFLRAQILCRRSCGSVCETLVNVRLLRPIDDGLRLVQERTNHLLPRDHLGFLCIRSRSTRSGLHPIVPASVDLTSGSRLLDTPQGYAGPWLTWNDWLGVSIGFFIESTPFPQPAAMTHLIHGTGLPEAKVGKASGVGSSDKQGVQSDGDRFLDFKAAKQLSRALQLPSQKAWIELCTSGALPQGVPSNPQLIYSDTGWRSWSDWLGCDRGWR